MQRCQAGDCFWIFLKPYRLGFLLDFLSRLRKPNTVQLFDSQLKINPLQLLKVESHLGHRRFIRSGRYRVVLSLLHAPLSFSSGNNMTSSGQKNDCLPQDHPPQFLEFLQGNMFRIHIHIKGGYRFHMHLRNTYKCSSHATSFRCSMKMYLLGMACNGFAIRFLGTFPLGIACRALYLC